MERLLPLCHAVQLAPHLIIGPRVRKSEARLWEITPVQFPSRELEGPPTEAAGWIGGGRGDRRQRAARSRKKLLNFNIQRGLSPVRAR